MRPEKKMKMQRKTQPANRESNLELYRIIVMLLIVAHHYVVNSGLVLAENGIYADPMSIKSLVLLLLGAWGKIGINCFVLITGYFMCTSGISWRKFGKLLLEIMFYRLLIKGIFWAVGYEAFSTVELIQAVIPVTQIASGFSAAFLVFYLFIPFLNLLIKNMTQKQHGLLLLLCGFLYVFLGTVPFLQVKMNYVSWFMVLYLIAAYIRLYPEPVFSNRKLWGWATAASVLLSATSVVVCTWLGTRLPSGLLAHLVSGSYANSNFSYYFVTDSNTFLAVATAVCSFLYVRNVNLRYCPWVNRIAATTFGVLLIHTAGEAMRKWLWNDLLRCVDAYQSPWVYLHVVVSVIGVFAVCSALDMLRIRFLEGPMLKLWDKIPEAVKKSKFGQKIIK